MKTAAAILAALCLCGCFPSLRAPAATVTAGSSVVSQTGAAQVPAKAETITTRATIPLPAGTEFRVVPVMPAPDASAFAFKLPEPAPLIVETTAERVSGPQAFTPPAPPSTSDISAGRLKLWYGIGIALGVAAGLFGLVRGWDFVMAGGGTVAAGCAFGLFVESHPVLMAVLGIGAALIVGGPLLWKFKLKHLPVIQ